jgi:ABC-type antimicrobial peptide transport system permease subunit
MSEKDKCVSTFLFDAIFVFAVVHLVISESPYRSGIIRSIKRHLLRWFITRQNEFYRVSKIRLRNLKNKAKPRLIP